MAKINLNKYGGKMATIKNFKISKYQYPDYFKFSNTDINTDIKKMERYTGTIFQQGDTINAEDHNEIQKNGVVFSKPVYSFENQISTYTLSDFTLEQEIFEGLKLKLLIDTDTESSTCAIKINETVYSVNEKFTTGNLYNLVYVNNQFMVEKSGGGLFTIKNLWTGQQDFFNNGDFMDVTLPNILSSVTSGILILRTVSQNYKQDIMIPVASLLNTYNVAYPAFVNQTTGIFFFQVSRENDDLKLVAPDYTVYMSESYFTAIDLVQ
jgi:hypothetical protein